MVKVAYTGTARAWSTAAYGGVVVERAETIDVDEEVADYLTSNHDFEEAPVDDESASGDLPPEFAILGETVPEVEERIEDGAYDGQLGALENVESDHADRKGVHEAIDERRNTLSDERESESDESDENE